MPKREGLRSADEMKWSSLFSAHGALTWIQAISIPKPPIKPQPISLGPITSNCSSPAILSLALTLQSELQATLPLSQAKKCLYHSSVSLKPSFLDIPIVTQTATSRVQSLMSLEALLTAPEMIF